VTIIGKILPALFLLGAFLFLFLPWALGRFARVFRRRRKGADEAALLLDTVNDLVQGVRRNESDLRDLYSRAEKRASFLERYHREILESMNTGVLACNRRGEVTAVNRAAGGILGIEAATARGKSIGALLGGKHLLAQTIRSVAHGEPVDERMELRVKRKGGETRWVELRTSLHLGKSGQTVGATFLLDDVTERKLLQKQVELKERLAAMGEVTAGIAHEFRNALHALSGLAKLIARRAEGDERIEPLAREILGETGQMERILNELRTFSKPQELALERVRLEELIRSVVTPFMAEQRERPVRVRVAVDPALPPIAADRTLLSQALRNLVQNAFSAMTEGGTLTIVGALLPASRKGRKGMRPGGGSHLLLSVSDTGPGIPEEIVTKVFTPFFTTRSDGTGLGLPLVQKIAAAHGGSVELESTPGRGTTFTLYIPLRASPSGAPRLPAESASRS